MASSSTQRRTVAVDTAASRPLVMTSVRSSARLQRPIGMPQVAGSSHAIALTSATTAAANTRGRPGRGRSRKPAYPCFSAFEVDGVTVAHVQLLMRRRPIFELGMLLFAHRMEDRHWQRTLHNLAAHFGVNQPVEYQTICLDCRRQWSKLGNVWHNAAAARRYTHLVRRFDPIDRPARHRTSCEAHACGRQAGCAWPSAAS
jgi:hypothetical protein